MTSSDSQRLAPHGGSRLTFGRHTLDLDPEYVREGLSKWRAAERRRAGDAAVEAAVAKVATVADDDAGEDDDTEHRGLRLVNRR